MSTIPGTSDYNVVVRGDVTVDRHLVEMIRGRSVFSIPELRTRNDPGGAYLLAELIWGYLGGWQDPLRAPHVDGPVIPEQALLKDDPGYPTTYHVWSEVSAGKGKGTEKNRAESARTQDEIGKADNRPKNGSSRLIHPAIELRYERCLGYRRVTSRGANAYFVQECSPIPPRVIVLDDRSLDFRQTRDLWPPEIRLGKTDFPNPWVVWKTTHPIMESELWYELYEKFRDRLVVILAADDLRALDIQVSRELSWERLADDFLQVVNDGDPRMKKLLSCFQVVVMIDTAGAIILPRSSGASADGGRLVFDPQNTSGLKDTVLDITPLHEYWMTASIAAQLYRIEPHAYPCAEEAVGKGVQISLSTLAELQEVKRCFVEQEAGGRRRLLLLEYLDNALRNINYDKGPKGAERFAVAKLPPPDRKKEWWTILEQKLKSRTEPTDLFEVAREIVERGPEEALKDVPVRKFEDLRLADRREIEGVLGIRRLFVEYLKKPQDVPLSIAVFGAPGSGKSFVVKELAKSVKPPESMYSKSDIRFLTFNLSQLDDPGELFGPLHQIRDSILSGYPTVAFWDEFDSDLKGETYGWLRYFLAPMQDGTFQEHQITHSIGGAFFVFAGGTCHRMETFGPKKKEVESSSKSSDGERSAAKHTTVSVENTGRQFPVPHQGQTTPAHSGDAAPTHALHALVALLTRSTTTPESITEIDWKSRKGPDFLSRLRGYLDVLGPNPDPNKSADQMYVIRRAILLHSFLKRRAPSLFTKGSSGGKVQIDRGVLDAFLYCGKYQHGARSMEAIIQMSLLADRKRFDRSSLPPRDQLKLHVGSDDFRLGTEGPLHEDLGTGSKSN